MLKFSCLFLCIVAMSLRSINAYPADDLADFRNAVQPAMVTCSQEHGVTRDLIDSAVSTGNTDGIKSCFIGCVMKTAKFFNDQGMLDVEMSLAHIKKFVKSAEIVAKYEEVGKKCIHVNEQAVSDGTAGCDRAKLLLTCLIENNAPIPV